MPIVHAPAGSPKGGQFSAGSTGPTPTNSDPVQQGQSGTTIQQLQIRLNRLTNSKLAVDGKFGPKTLAAVKALQKKYGLKVDGLVGPKTTAAMRGARVGGKTSTTKSPAAKATTTKTQMQYLKKTQSGGK